MCAHTEKAFSSPEKTPWTQVYLFRPLLSGGRRAEASFPIISQGKDRGLSEVEDLHFSILYIPLVPQLTWLLRGWGTCIAGKWNGDKAYGEDRGGEGKGIIAVGEGGLQWAAPLPLHPPFPDYCWVEESGRGRV